jgi:small subunit ribosomal protein S20
LDTEFPDGQYQLSTEGDPPDRARTIVNKARRSRLRTAVVKIEEAIATGDRTRALAALNDGEPIIMRAAQKGIIHKNAASRKVSRLAHRVAKLGQ